MGDVDSPPDFLPPVLMADGVALLTGLVSAPNLAVAR